MENETATEAVLADVLRRYWEGHAKTLPSASGIKAALGLWLDYWQDAPVSRLTVQNQEEFHKWLRARGQKSSTVLKTINMGKAALSRAHKRQELAHMPLILTVKAGTAPPKGKPMEVEELAALYQAAAPHVRTFIRWGLGTAARPAALLELHSRQVDWSRGVVDLNPVGREQNKKHRPKVKLPEALGMRFDGHLMTWRGRRVQGIRTGWEKAVERAGLDAECQPYSLRHSAARWMRLHGVPMDEVGQQLGHRAKAEAVTAIYTEYDPRYLARACAALNELVLASCKPE